MFAGSPATLKEKTMRVLTLEEMELVAGGKGKPPPRAQSKVGGHGSGHASSGASSCSSSSSGGTCAPPPLF